MPDSLAAPTSQESPDLESLVSDLQRLVRIPSTNPGDDERAVVAAISELLSGTGADLTVVEHAPGRPSLAAVLRGTRGGPTFVLNGHTDTVPIDDPGSWTTDPFGGEVRNGYLYGRGACDMKAGLVIAIAIARDLAREVPADQRGTLILHFAAGEERGEPGTLALLEAGFAGDFGVVMEPTRLQVATATRGVGRYTIRIKGKAGHASQPQGGRNPIWALGRVLDAVARHNDEVGALSHPMLPSGACTPTMVRAGVSESAIPDWCDVLIDRRLVPGETAAGEAVRISALLDKLMEEGLPDEVELRLITELAADPAEIPRDAPLAELLLDLVDNGSGGSSGPVGMPYGSDTRNLVNDAGMEALTFGPGDIADCHCADERVPLADLDVGARILADLVHAILVEGRLDDRMASTERGEPE